MKLFFYYFVYLLTRLLFTPVVSSEDDSTDCATYNKASKRIKCEILKDYDPIERPVQNIKDYVLINLNMFPVSFEMDEYDDELSLTVWMVMDWFDPALTWDKDIYDGLDKVNIDCTDIWKPDIITLNVLSDFGYQTSSNSICNIRSNGTVDISYSTTYRTNCVVDRTYWPYDEHTCQLDLGASTFSGPSLQFNLQDILIDSLKKDKTWDIRDMQPTVMKFPLNEKFNENATYTKLEFVFILRRHSSVMALGFVFPGLAMAIIGIAVLWLDVTLPERLYMFALVVFNNIIFLESYNYMFPAGGVRPPLIILFFRDSIAMNGLAICLTIINRILLNSTLQPVFLTVLVRWFNEKTYLKTYLLIDIDTEVTNVKEDDETNPSTFSLKTQARKDWKVFVTLCDRILFISFLIINLALLFRFFKFI